MTLLVRDEIDLVDAQIAFHLGAGVDFVIATDNRSGDGTTAILESYAREGHLHLIHEPGDNLLQSEWVTRMARLAATEFGADWVINADADEFWWPRGGSLKEIFGEVPERYGVVSGLWRHFVPRPDDGRFFAERMTIRSCVPVVDRQHPFNAHVKSAHRGVADVRVGRGNHEAFGSTLLPLRGWYPIEVLHFPVRTAEQCERKYVNQGASLARNPTKSTPGHVGEAYEAYSAGRIREFYDALVILDAGLEAGLRDGTLAFDTRLRDALRALRTVELAPASRARQFGSSSSPRCGVVFPEPSLAEEAEYAAEVSLYEEAFDLSWTLQRRLDELERRIAAREPTPWSRIRHAAAARGIGR